MIKLLNGPKWSAWKAQIEQSGYEVRHRDYVFAVMKDGEPVAAIVPQMENGRLMVWGEDSENPEHFTAPEQAMADLLQKLGIEYPLWPGGGGIFMTREQMAAFSAEWQELFREVAAKGHLVSRHQSGVIEIANDRVYILIQLSRGQWVLNIAKPSEWYEVCVHDHDDDAIEVLRGWVDLIEFWYGRQTA